jgi:hypothetical protein
MLIAALFATVCGIAGSLACMWGRLAIGGALLLTSVLALRWPRSLWSGPAAAELSPRARRLGLLAVCATAVFFRTYHLNQPGLWGDDALNGLLAFDILDGKIRSPFQIVRHSYSSFHALSDYPIAAAFRLFGPDLTTLRLPGIVLGALCVPLLYATVAPLFGSSVALLAALFYATSAPQLTHAKQLVQIITGQFFQLAGLCLLVRGLTARRGWLTASAGLPLALCVYTYHSARIAPLVGLAVAVAWLAVGRWSSAASGAHPDDRRPATRALLAALLVFLVALIPAAIGYVRDPGALAQRLETTSLWPLVREQHSLWPLWETLWRSALMFHYAQGPEYDWFGIGTDPAVNVVIGFLFLHGLCESLARWREPRHVLLLAWFAVGLAPACLSSGAPRLYRAFLATPPLYVWAALPLVRLLAAGAPGWSRMVMRGLAVGLIAAVPLIDFNYYFYRVYTSPAFRWFQGERMVEMARTLRSFGPGWTGYLMADTYNAEHETFRFLARAWGLDIRDVGSLTEILPLRDPPPGGALFIMSEATLDAAPAIAQMYPGEDVILRREPTPRTWWLDAWWPLAPTAATPKINAGFYPVTRAAAARPRTDPAYGLAVDYSCGGAHLVRHEPYPFYAFFAPAFSGPDAAAIPAGRLCDALWRGRLQVPEPGGFRLDVQADANATTLIDGHAVDPTDPLPAGSHDLRLRLRNLSQRPRLAISWRRDGEPVPVPPSAFLPPDAPPPSP